MTGEPQFAAVAPPEIKGLVHMVSHGLQVVRTRLWHSLH